MYITIIYILIIMNNQQIEQIYKQFNRPGPAKLLELSKAAGLQVKAKDINDFLQKNNNSKKAKTGRKAWGILLHSVLLKDYS